MKCDTYFIHSFTLLINHIKGLCNIPKYINFVDNIVIFLVSINKRFSFIIYIDFLHLQRRIYETFTLFTFFTSYYLLYCKK